MFIASLLNVITIHNEGGIAQIWHVAYPVQTTVNASRDITRRV